jgi:hypothetical protein
VQIDGEASPSPLPIHRARPCGGARRTAAATRPQEIRWVPQTVVGSSSKEIRLAARARLKSSRARACPVWLARARLVDSPALAACWCWASGRPSSPPRHPHPHPRSLTPLLSPGLPFGAATTGRAAAPFATSSPGPSPPTSTHQVCPPPPLLPPRCAERSTRNPNVSHPYTDLTRLDYAPVFISL